MTPSFSCVVNHTPWVPERVEALAEMRFELFEVAGPLLSLRIHDEDYRGTDWQAAKVEWALTQWRWAARKPESHHVFLTDDLNLSPGFWAILSAMVQAHPAEPIGLLSNHPRGPELFAQGYSGYRTNSWLVGPAYVLPHDHLVRFLTWFEALPDGDPQTVGTKGYRNDDSSINEWITNGGGGGQCWHPLPTIIEHRSDIGSTVGHGDQYSRERVSWRRGRRLDFVRPVTQLMAADYWANPCPMLALPEDGR